MDPLTIILILSLGFGGGVAAGRWHPLAWLAPKAPVVALAAAQADRDALKKQLADSEARAKADAVALAAKTDAQLAGVQQMAAGAHLAHARVPLAHQVAEERLADSFVTRVQIRLVSIRGAMSAEDEAEIEQIVAGALSAKQAEVDAANAKLAVKDADFTRVTQEKAAVLADKAKVDATVAVQEATLKAKDAAVDTLTGQISDWAVKKEAADAKAGSLFGALTSAKHWLEALGVIAALIAAVALYLRMGLGSVGKALHPLQKVLSPADYQAVVTGLDGETDKLHQWLIRGGRKAAAAIEAKIDKAV